MSEKILIIDDEQDIADLLDGLLEKRNYVVINFIAQRMPCRVLKAATLILPFWILCSRIERLFTLPAYAERNTLIQHNADG